MLYRFIKSLKIAINAGIVAMLSIALHTLANSTHQPVDWPWVRAAAGRAAIFVAVIFVLVFAGILKPRSKARPKSKTSPLVWALLGVVAVTVVVWAMI